MSENLYEKYSGAFAIPAIVREFYQRILADEKLAGFFRHVDMDRLTAHQVNFIGRALGGPEVYDGADLTAIHAPLEIDDEAFNRVAHHLADALEYVGVELEDRKSIIEIIGSLREQIVHIT